MKFSLLKTFRQDWGRKFELKINKHAFRSDKNYGMAFSTSALRTKIEQTYINHQKQFTEINVSLPSTLSLLSLFYAEKNIPSKTPAQHQVSDIMQIVFTFLCHIILHGVSQDSWFARWRSVRFVSLVCFCYDFLFKSFALFDVHLLKSCVTCFATWKKWSNIIDPYFYFQSFKDIGVNLTGKSER